MNRKIELAKQKRTQKAQEQALVDKQIQSQERLTKAVDGLYELLNGQEQYDFDKLHTQLVEIDKRLDLAPHFKSLEKSITTSHKPYDNKTKIEGFSELLRAVKTNKPIPSDIKLDKLEKAVVNIEQYIREQSEPEDKGAENYKPVRRVVKMGNRFFFDDNMTSGGGGGSGGNTDGLTDAQLRASPVPVTATIDTTGLATSTKQSDGSQKTQIVDSGGEAATVTGGKLDVNATASLAGTALPIAGASEGVGVAIVDGSGNQITSFGGGTQYTEDAAAAANPVGTALNMVRDDARAGGLTTADGDNVAARGNNKGELYVKATDTDALLTTIDADTGTIATEVAGLLTDTELRATPVPVSGTVTSNLGTLNGAATSAKQDTIIGHVDGIEGHVDQIEGYVDGIEGLLTSIDSDTGTLAATDFATEAKQDDIITAIGAIPGGGGVQYTEGDTDATFTGTMSLVEGAANAAVTLKQPTTPADTQPVSGTVTANTGLSQPLTDTQLRATPVPVSGTVTANLSATDNGVLDDIDAVLDTIKVDTEAIETAVEALQAGQLPDGHNVTIDNPGDIGGGVQYTQGDTDASITGTAALMEVGSDTLQPVQGTVADGLLVNLGSNNDVTVSGVSTSAKQDTIIGHLDGVETLLTDIEADTDTLAVVGSGTEATAQRVTIATDSTGVLSVDDNGSSLTVDNAGLTELASAINSDKVDVNIASSGIALGGTSAADDADFTAGTTAGTPAMGVYESTPTAVTDGDLGTVGITSGRRLKTSATIDAALPAGTNNIGDVDVVSMPTTTVQATNLDIRDLTNTDVVTAELSATDNAVLDAIAASTAAIDTDTTTLIGHVDGVETAVASTNTKLDTVNTNLGTIDGRVDGLETLVTSTNTKLDTVNTNLGTIDGRVDGLEASNSAIQTATELLDDTVATLGTTTYTETTTKGLTIGAVRRDANTTLVGTTNEVAPLQVNATGELKVAQIQALPAGTNNIGDVDIASIAAGDNNIGNVDVVTIPVAFNSGATSATTQRVITATDAGAAGRLAANSGVDIGDVDVTSAVSATLDHGSNRDVDTAAEQITSTSFAAKFGVTLRADSANTGILYIGNSDVTANTTAATDGIPLHPGDSLFLPVTNSNIPYAIASANNQIIYWFAV